MTKRITPRGAVRIYNNACTLNGNWGERMAELLNNAGPGLPYFYPWKQQSVYLKRLELKDFDRAIDRLQQLRDGLAQSIGD